MNPSTPGRRCSGGRWLAVQAHRGADGAAGHVERADQAGPSACAPSSSRSRPSRYSPSCQRPPPGDRAGAALDLDRRADLGMVEVFVAGDAADGRRRYVADALRPLRGEGALVVEQLAEGTAHRRGLMGDEFLVGQSTSRPEAREVAVERGIDAGVSKTTALPDLEVPHQRLAGVGIAQVKPLGATR